MKSLSFGDEVRRYIALTLNWGWLLLLTTLLAGVMAYLISYQMRPIYQASAKILINQAPATKAADYASVLTSERLAQTYAEIITTKRVLDAVIDDLSLSYTAELLEEAIVVEPVMDTQLIQVYLEDPNPRQAVTILNRVIDVFIAQNTTMQEERFGESKKNLSAQLEETNQRIRQANLELEQLGNSAEDQASRARIETSLAEYRRIYSSLLLSFEQVRLAEAQSISTLIPVERPEIPKLPIRPQVALNTILAAILGLVIGIAIVFFVEALDDSINSPDDIHRHLGLPVLGFILRHKQDLKLIAAEEPRSPITEAFRALRTNLQFASVDHPLCTLLITSPSPADGKSTVAANLSAVLAQGGKNVILVDGDLRKPNIHNILDIPNRVGMSSLFVQTLPQVEDSFESTQVEGLSVLTAGEVPPNPSELLGSEKFINILEGVKKKADVVIIDSPPVMAVTDSAVLAPRVDGVLLVIKPGTTNLAASKQAVEQLQRVGAKVMGVVLNEVEFRRSRYQSYHYKGYYYSYQYYYHENGSRGDARKKNGLPWRREKTGKEAT